LATGAFEIGDPDLDLEKALSFDRSLRKQTGRVTGSLGFFYTRFRDFVSSQATGLFAEAEEGEEVEVGEKGEEPLPIFVYRAVDANFLRVEVETNLSLIEPAPSVMGKDKDGKSTLAESGRPLSLDLEPKADYAYAEESSNRPLPRIPRFRARAASSFATIVSVPVWKANTQCGKTVRPISSCRPIVISSSTRGSNTPRQSARRS
jgi:hypothetical protein